MIQNPKTTLATSKVPSVTAELLLESKNSRAPGGRQETLRHDEHPRFGEVLYLAISAMSRLGRVAGLGGASPAQSLPAARLLPARAGRGTLRSDLLRLELSLDSGDFDLDRIKPLLKAALADNLDDALIWDRIHPASPAGNLLLQQTPWLRNTSSFANSSEDRKYVDNRETGGVRKGSQVDSDTLTKTISEA
ncbi:hypothetical protein DL770_011815 [Monosporascus sp. CRB-9-2]|nr:hypothetical protein DL770_011815 [Monosporascus sp. CRB-9-2]